MGRKRGNLAAVEGEGQEGGVEETTRALPGGFKVKRHVTVPQLKIEDGDTAYVLILGEMYVGKQIEEKEGEKKKEPATLMRVKDLSDVNDEGEPIEKEVIVNAVLQGILRDEVKDYVGKAFAITKLEKAQGKNYHRFMVDELEKE